ncbi:homeobox protein TGIF1-like [Papio anubis]|uniref:homeobox protein TGIF1-like n=1 Tax=Papio anubis TaxID=9555 RepID=UPI00083F1A86|nr:homeobox protein TGIF1-like [Papio anubis]
MILAQSRASAGVGSPHCSGCGGGGSDYFPRPAPPPREASMLLFHGFPGVPLTLPRHFRLPAPNALVLPGDPLCTLGVLLPLPRRASHSRVPSARSWGPRLGPAGRIGGNFRGPHPRAHRVQLPGADSWKQ